MADFLRINGLPITVLNGTAKHSLEYIGTADRALDGTMRAHRRATKGRWSFTAAHRSAADAMALRDLLLGRGHHWDFSSLYSSKGLGPDAGYAASVSGLELSVDATTGTITYAAQLGSSWTLMFWRYESGAYHHYGITNEGHKWYDGSRNDALSASWVNVSGGSFTITNSTGSAVKYIFLTALPFILPDDWLPDFYAYEYFSPLGQLYADGEFIEAGDSTKTVVAEVGEMDIVQGILDGAWTKNIHVMPVVLMEV